MRRIMRVMTVCLLFSAVGLMAIWLMNRPEAAAPIVPLIPAEAEQFEVITPENAQYVQEVHKIVHGDEDNKWPSSITAIAYSHDSRWIATSDRRDVKIWDVKTGYAVETLASEDGLPNQQLELVFSPNGKWLIITSSDAVEGLWNTQTGKALTQFQWGNGYYGGLIFTSNNQMVIFQYETKELQAWDLESLTYRVIEGTFDNPTLKTSDSEQHIWIDDSLWDITSWTKVEAPYQLLPPSQRWIYCPISYTPDGPVISPDGRFATGVCDYDFYIRLQQWNAQTGVLIRNWEAASFPVAYSPSSEILISHSGLDRIALWHSATGLPLTNAFSVPNGFRTSSMLAFSPDGRTFAASNGMSLHIFAVSRDTDSRRCSVADPEQDILLNLRYGDLSHLTVIQQIEKSRPGLEITFSNDGRYVVEKGHEFLRVWELATGESVFFAEDPALMSIESLSLEYTRLVNLQPVIVKADITFKFDNTMEFPDRTSANFYHIIPEDGRLVIRDQAEKEMSVIEDVGVSIIRAALSPDKTLIVGSTYENHISLWDITSYTAIQHLYKIKTGRRYNGMAFRADGRYFAALVSETGGEWRYDAIQIWGICDP